MTYYNSINLFNNVGRTVSLGNIGFRGTTVPYTDKFETGKDSFSTNPLNDFGNKSSITNVAKSNPEIMRILKENKIPLEVNIEELEKLKRGHLMNSRITVAKMYSALPENIKQTVNMADLQEAAMLHDYGKVLIPKEILNKKGALNPNEKQIMDLHSELGYELLKSKGVRPSVLKLVKYHHQNSNGTGYPKVNNDFEYNTELAMLAAADKYSALTENRSYKSAMPRREALNIIKEDVDTGQLPQEVYDALEHST